MFVGTKFLKQPLTDVGLNSSWQTGTFVETADTRKSVCIVISGVLCWCSSSSSLICGLMGVDRAFSAYVTAFRKALKAVTQAEEVMMVWQRCFLWLLTCRRRRDRNISSANTNVFHRIVGFNPWIACELVNILWIAWVDMRRDMKTKRGDKQCQAAGASG